MKWQKHIKNTHRLLSKVLCWYFLFAGAAFTFILIFAFTSVPFYMMHNKGTAHIPPPDYTPDYLVLMGGAGMPNPANLMRAYYTAKEALKDTTIKILIALPGDINDSLSDVNLLAQELELRGVQHNRILLENSGTNTRQQALECHKMLGEGPKITIVTSAVHVPRAVLAFRKAGFSDVHGIPAFDIPNNADLTFSEKELGDRRLPGNIGENLNLRYRFWWHLHLQIMLTREFVAMQYYRILSWI